MLIKIIGIMVVLMMAMSGVSYWYYKDSQEKIATLNKENSALNISAKICEDTVNSLQLNQARVNSELSRVNRNFATIRQQNTVLAKKLEKHDIGVLGAAKPKLVERVINNAVNKSARCMELLSGAKLTTKEQSAATGKEFNSECPWLWPGNKQ